MTRTRARGDLRIWPSLVLEGTDVGSVVSEAVLLAVSGGGKTSIHGSQSIKKNRGYWTYYLGFPLRTSCEMQRWSWTRWCSWACLR